MQTMTLLNQARVPVLGFGTYKITDPTLAKESVTEAICRGYRHVDTAAFYENELAGSLSGNPGHDGQKGVWQEKICL